MNSTIKSTKNITNHNSKIIFQAKLSYGFSGQKKIFSALTKKYDLKIDKKHKWLLDNLKNSSDRKFSNEQISILKIKSHWSLHLNKKDAFTKLTKIFKKPLERSKQLKEQNQKNIKKISKNWWLKFSYLIHKCNFGVKN